MVLLNLLVSFGGTLLLFALYQIIGYFYRQFTSPLRDLPGPKNRSFIYGNFKEIWQSENSVLHEKWLEEYGPTITYKGFLNTDRLFTMDTKALTHVLMNNNVYQKPAPARYNLTRILGAGLLVVEGEKHRKQRRIMNPAFGPGQIRELTGIFVEKANQLRDIWSAELAKKGDELARIDALMWLSRATFDIIGMAGFDYKFNTLNNDGKPSELSKAFSTIFHAGAQLSLLPILQAYIPIARRLPLTKRDYVIRQAKATMSRIGLNLVQDSKAAIASNAAGRSSIGKGDVQARDLLSLLIRANMDTDLPETHRLSDEDVVAQVPTFLVAGHETTSTATTWALYALSIDQAIQAKLRNELLSLSTDNPTMDELNALPYLDAVVRETLRVHAPVPATIRVATKDDILPLNTPFVDKKGVSRDCVRIRKGETIFVPILAMNRSKSLWGEDAREFKPERWESIPEAVSCIPGVWGNMLTFSGGPRACIGYRFSIVETKALLFALVRAFEFKLAVPASDIVKKTTIVQRPLVISDPNGGNQMPLLVKAYRGQ